MSRKRPAYRKFWKNPGAAGLAALCLALLVVSVLQLSGCAEEASPEKMGETVAPISSIPGLSPDQNRLMEEMGYPDHFFISIDPYSSDRMETWVYYSEGLSIDFNNGRRFGEEGIEDESNEYPSTALRPQDFDTLLTPEGAEQLLGSPLYTQQVEDSLSTYDNTIMVFDKAILLFRSGQLIGVETKVSPPRLPLP